jgi:hypothetical protein
MFKAGVMLFLVFSEGLICFEHGHQHFEDIILSRLTPRANVVSGGYERVAGNFHPLRFVLVKELIELLVLKVFQLGFG